MPEKNLIRWRNAIFALYLILAIGYNLRTPYSQPGTNVPAGLELGTDLGGTQGNDIPDIGAPDERAHVFYIRHLSGGNGFPVFTIGDGDAYENHQPPLYYLLCVPIQRAARDAEGFVLRLFTTLIGMVALNGVFLICRRFASEVATLAITATAALLPSYLALTSAVSNDPLLIVWFTYGLLLCVAGAQEGWTLKRLLLLGVICGLAMLTKTSALALVGFALLAVLITSPKTAPLKAFGNAAVVGIVAAVLMTPWLIRNASLYGDPLGMKIFTEGFANSPKADMFIAAYGGFDYLVKWVGWWTLRSMFGVFGYAQFFFPTWLYLPGAVLAGLGLGGGLVRLRGTTPLQGEGNKRTAGLQARNNTHIEDGTAVTRLCWLLFAVVLIAFLRFNMTYFQAQARYLLPALAPIAIALCLGPAQLVPMKYRRNLIFIAPAYLLILNVYALSTLGPAFQAISR